jgi:hypothetical protein
MLTREQIEEHMEDFEVRYDLAYGEREESSGDV